MADRIVHIKCPQCGSVLSVLSVPGIEGKNVTCPVCKYKGRFTTFRAHVPNANQYPGEGEDHTQYGPIAGGGESPTEIKDSINILPGQLRVVATGSVFKLKPGRNVIGRLASKSSADIQLPTGMSKRMSREHIVIDVKKVACKGLTAFVSLCKELVNKTFVNGNELVYGDVIVLNDGDTITLPDMKVKYEIPDEEKTDYNI
jgi:hypothetical protein